MSATEIRHRLPADLRQQRGVVLLEALVSILIIAFGILGIIGLQAASVASVSDARYRIEATELADELINQIWVDTSNANVLPAYASNSSSLPTAWLAKVKQLPGAADNPPTISTAANNEVTLTISWHPAGGEVHKHRVVTAINRNVRL